MGDIKIKIYTHETINALIQPLIDFMKQEYPNDYVLEINSNGAELYHKAITMAFISKELQDQWEKMKVQPIDDETMNKFKTLYGNMFPNDKKENKGE